MTTLIFQKESLPKDFLPYLNWIESQKTIMVESLEQLASINSFSGNPGGVGAVAHQLGKWFTDTGGHVETIELPPVERLDDNGRLQRETFGPLLRVTQHPDASLRVLLVGHLDTVFPPDHPFQKVSCKTDGVMHGPGVADLKGGLIVMLTALKCLAQSPWAANIGWQVIANPDEETGSIGSAGILAEAARRHHVGFVYEPSPPDGSFVSARKGTGTFTVVIRGRSAHAGRDFNQGRNAVHAVAAFIDQLFQLNGRREGVTINPGFVTGGGPVNIVPDRALARFNIRIARREDETWVMRCLEEVQHRVAALEGISVQISGRFTRVPKVIDEKHKALFEMVTHCGRQLGLPMAWRPSGGCCDGNNLAEAGLPNVDTLGVVGGNIHTGEEYMRLDSLVSRAKLSALLLLYLASGRLELSR